MEGRIFSLEKRVISRGEENTIHMACLSTNEPNCLVMGKKKILKGMDCDVPGTMILWILSI